MIKSGHRLSGRTILNAETLLMFIMMMFVPNAGLASQQLNNLLFAEKSRSVIDVQVQEAMASCGADEKMAVWIFFTDKGVLTEKEYEGACRTTENSTADRTLRRREKVKESDLVDIRDLPVVNDYIETIVAMGARHRTTTRWFNGISAEVPAGMLADIAAFSFVREIRMVGTYQRSPLKIKPVAEIKRKVYVAGLDYGSSLAQLQQINVPAVHDLGYSGEGVLVCMLDTGFNRDHESLQNIDVVAEWDFIHDDGNTRNEEGDASNQHDHGTYTLSTLGGIGPGHLYGPAYGASFLLGKTEDVSDEQPVEEDYWVEGIEWAEANGADVVSSSLGYFDWYTYEDMDGNTAMTTKAADLAAQRGVVVCTAAGNERDGSWYYIIAPADGDSVITCGAVNSEGNIAAFSSAGPTYDGRTKPEVVARGVATVCASPSDPSAYLTVGGTSLSTPLIGGAAALVLQAHPEWTPMQVREALMMTASRADAPDNLYGWGIIDALAAIQAGSQADDPNPPDETVKLIFIHHSCGENWLNDGNGGLGQALADNHYFVSDVNYGWGPDNIGDNTDIGHWWTWFRGDRSATYMAALYDEFGDHSYNYTRLSDPDPARGNEVIMFKSCFPNSNLGGNPNDPPTSGSNPLRGQDCYSGYHTVANAKGIYNDLLTYFASRQDKLFVVIAAPPVQDGTWADNARAFNTWLVQDWLTGYAHDNVAIFDFYNVLTSNGGDWETNDLGWDTGNHHRYRSGAIQYVTNQGGNTAAYSNGDDHPSSAGNQKGTAEFLPLLNIFYHRWTGAQSPCSVTLTSFDAGGTWCVGQSPSITWTSENTSGTVRLTYSVNNGSTWSNIVSSTPDDGSYAWTIPNVSSSQCLVRICDTIDSDCCDQSTTAFTICRIPQAEFVAAPLQDEGQSCQVRFSDRSSGCITSWSWDFGDGQTSSQQNPQHVYDCRDAAYTVRLIVSGPCGADTAREEECLSCACPCQIEITSPNGGETWCAGGNADIVWNNEFPEETVRIDCSLNGGTTWSAVTAGTPDDGLFEWAVPNESSMDCLIRILSNSDPACGDTSLEAFQICECQYLNIATPALPDGKTGCPYGITLEITGGCSPFSWSITAGGLPEGLNLESTSGRLYGMPEETGDYAVTIAIADKLDNSASRPFALHIGEHSQTKGDVQQDCTVNVVDVVVTVNFILELSQPSDEQRWCADCNGPQGQCDGDGLINILDALKIVGLILGTDMCP